VVENDVPLDSALEPELDDSPEVFFDDGVTAPEDDSQEIVETGPEELGEPEPEEISEPVIEKAPERDDKEQVSSSEQQTAKKPRASMPSWDQIVFGTKSED